MKRARWNARHNRLSRHIIHNYSTSSDDSPLTDGKALTHRSAGADVRTASNTHTSTQPSACSDMDMVTNYTIMLYNSSCVHDDVDSDNRTRIDYCRRIND